MDSIPHASIKLNILLTMSDKNKKRLLYMVMPGIWNTSKTILIGVWKEVGHA